MKSLDSYYQFKQMQHLRQIAEAQTRPTDEPAPRRGLWRRWQAFVYRQADKLL